MDDVEERIRELEGIVADLRVSDAERRVVLNHLLTEVDNLTRAIEHLTSTINRGKGALWVLLGVGAAVGSGVHWLADLIVGSHH